MQSIKINEVEIDLVLAVKRVTEDIKDDWFSDPSEFIDLLNPNYIKKIIESYLTPKDFKPNRVKSFNLPKKNFSLRYSFESSLIERIIYQGIGDILIKEYDQFLSKEVYSYRYNDHDNGKYMFLHPIESWQKYTNDFKLTAEENREYYIVETDILNYFENILFRELKDILNNFVNKISDELKKEKLLKTNNLLLTYLKNLSEYKNRGIPQNLNTSSLIGNLYLSNLDQQILKKEIFYFRYMDDLKIIVKNENTARDILKILITELRKIGLNVNSSKTNIYRIASQKYEENIIKKNREIEEIDFLMKSRKFFIKRRAIPKLFNYIKKLIYQKNNEYDSREFNFCIYRLEVLARVEILEKNNFGQFSSLFIRLLYLFPWNTSKYVSLLKNIPITKKQEKRIIKSFMDNSLNIYEWQSYHIWSLLTAKKFKDQRLVDFAKDAINTSDPFQHGVNIAGAAIYLATCGNEKDIDYIISKIKKFKSSFTKRHFILGIADNANKQQFTRVNNILEREERDILQNFRNNYQGLVNHNKKKLSINDLYNNLPDIPS